MSLGELIRIVAMLNYSCLRTIQALKDVKPRRPLNNRTVPVVQFILLLLFLCYIL